MPDSQIINLAAQILSDATRAGASDVHFEPYEATCRVRIRVDGILCDFRTLDVSVAQRLTSRLKVMSKLDIAERRLPQDGRFTLRLDEQDQTATRNCRISSCPTLFGEKIVVRLLHPSSMTLGVGDLGLSAHQQQIFATHLAASQGLVLVTGPTGSGKTVTLYSALTHLNSTNRNISTAEDPVEINLAGINQVEINPKIGLTFATALRAFLRQDPDIIMVGEIRDLETAQIAITAAQTGHLVLSTLHTNSSAESIARLINMGVATFNLASSNTLFIAQRLLRKLCPKCKIQRTVPHELLGKIFTNAPANFTAYEATTGCSHCQNGYSGRIGIFELLPLSRAIQDLILANAGASGIERQAQIEGMQTLRESALKLVLDGATSLAEVSRVL